MGYVEMTPEERSERERKLREIAEAVNVSMDPARQPKLIRLGHTWADAGGKQEAS